MHAPLSLFHANNDLILSFSKLPLLTTRHIPHRPLHPSPIAPFCRIFFNTDLVNDNYFYAGYFLGHYTPENCPRYLKKENYEKMKKHLKVSYTSSTVSHSTD